jgi:hypothetical protein
MPVHFFDTSAISKHYHAESGTAKVDALLGATDAGWRMMLFCTRCYNRVLRPGLAEIVSHQDATPQSLNRTVNLAAVAIDAWIDQHTVAA